MGRCIRRSVATFVASLIGLAALSACVKPPDLRPIANSSDPDQVKNPGSISINEVVKRIKCEIRDSIADRLGKDYGWFQKWTITADLQLAVNDNSQISPGLVLTHQFLLGNIPQRVSNFGQSSSLGLGGQVSTTATRTEIVSFSMSAKEIANEFFDRSGHPRLEAAEGYNGCLPYGVLPVGLTGKLGLKEWVDSALGPVTTTVGPYPGHPLLDKGLHKPAKGPGSGGGAAAPKTSGAGQNLMTFERFRGDLKTQQEIQKGNPGLSPQLNQLLPNLTDQPEKLPNDLKTELEKIIGDLATLQGAEAKAPKDFETIARLEKTQQQGRPLSEQDVQDLRAARVSVGKIVKQRQAVLKEITDVLPKLQARCDCNADDFVAPSYEDRWMAYVLKCLKTDKSLLQAVIPKTPTYDPPIDAISHQVQFIVVLNASANPTWTMLNFKGPSPTSGSFGSATDTNTHTLTIVMGEPSSAAVTNARSALTFGSAVSSQIVPQLPPSSAPVF